MKSSIKAASAILVFLLGTEISAQTSGGRGAAREVFPRLDPDPKALEYASWMGRGAGYSWTDLAEISLWASSGETAANLMEQIRAAAAELRASPELPAAGRGRAEYVLTFMHKKFLKSYSLNQTRIDTLLAGGRYNCVSSAVLYMILARSAGLDVSGVMTKDHAFAEVHINGESIDVETTNPYGFDPGSRREFHDEFGKLTGFAYVPARNYRDRAAIRPIELVSLIISNRISDLEARSRFAEAVPLAIDRAFLLMGERLSARASAGSGLRVPVSAGGSSVISGGTSAVPLFEEPRRDMMNRLFNYGAFLLKSGKEEECLRWAALAAPRYPEEERWEEFILAAVNNRTQKLVKAGQPRAAREFLNSQKSALNPANYAILDSVLTDTELLDAAAKIRNVDEGEGVIAAIERARGGSQISAGRAAELLTFTVQKTASIISAAPARDWPAAIGYIEKVIARFGPVGELEQTLRNYRANLAADFHNRFAEAWNRKNFAEAEQILNEGLAMFPDNYRLLTDRQTVDKNRTR
jgi:tetratricopeptide (TPR) repeat protein